MCIYIQCLTYSATPFPVANVPGAGTGVPGVQQSAVFSHRHQDGRLPSYRMCSLRQVSSTFIQCPNGHWWSIRTMSKLPLVTFLYNVQIVFAGPLIQYSNCHWGPQIVIGGSFTQESDCLRIL